MVGTALKPYFRTSMTRMMILMNSFLIPNKMNKVTMIHNLKMIKLNKMKTLFQIPGRVKANK